MDLLQQFLTDDGGATMVEYGLVVALVTLVVAVAVGALGVNVRALYDTIIAAPF